MSEATHETLHDGAIRVCLGGVCGTVSSWHLVAQKERQLERLREGLLQTHSNRWSGGG